MRVCYFGTYERDYPRNRVVIDALRSAGVEVRECHLPLWELSRHKTGEYLRPGSLVVVALRILCGYIRLAREYLRQSDGISIVMVGYIGQLDLLLVKLLMVVGRRRRLIFNPLVSLYDTVVDDRGLFSPDSLPARLLFQLDRLSFRLADRIVLDTDVHIDYISQKFGIQRNKFRRLFVGADENIFFPRDGQAQEPPLVVLFVGKFIPLHGIPTIVAAASQLQDDPGIRLEIVGSGQLYPQIMELCDRLQVTNITFTDWVPYQLLPEKMSRAHVCLGIFGEGGKASRVIPNKVFQALAMGQAVITGDSPASRELLTHGRNAILVPMAQPQALAQAIRQMKDASPLRNRLASAGQAVFAQRCGREVLGRELLALCQEVVHRR
jgi:glycosyltransferase involved in cell wall biosynthesis